MAVCKAHRVSPESVDSMEGMGEATVIYLRFLAGMPARAKIRT
jgi:hypothetical protein